MIALAPTASVRASNLQREASDPRVSAFVAASAGSGKTKLLIDRLLRLMLVGADPSRILCLTFTKAAAAEMALRLQRILGEWVTLPDDALMEALKQRGITPASDVVARARALFAEVLDLPGGMRISTIHAFCQSLLRRFPLEAALAPHFRLLEDADGQAELHAAREDAMAEADPAALAVIAGLVSDLGFGRLVGDLRSKAAKLAPLLRLPGPARRKRLDRAVGVSGDDAALVRAGVEWPDGALRAVIAELKANGSASERELADRMADWLGLSAELRAEHWEQWLTLLLTKDGAPRKAGGFCKSKWAKSDPALAAACVAEAERAAALEDDRRALKVAALTDALLTLAAPVLAGFEHRKQRAGLLDYDDLINRTSNLLLDPGTAWVLFKLDGGLDHLLLDEVQDTAPEQWAIAGALTAEFFAQEMPEEGARTVFAVGDRKQSIYSFQGADPAEFDRWRGRMRGSVQAAGGRFRDTVLDVSFRSTSAVLGLVDHVFADPVARIGIVPAGDTLLHEADRAGQGGRVELWPLVPLPPQETPEPWAVAERNHGLTTAPQRLAEALARWIAAQIGHTMLPSRGRPIEAGDILILVRRRDDFARALVRRLKGLGVPVAGLDRLYLTDQPAVQDLLALCDTLLLPEDDLSLACVLTSPLGDLTDDDLMALAIDREGSLWSALRHRRADNPHWARAAAFIEALLARVDYVTPHALLVEALGPLGGRARLLRRLGPEAAEPLDELLGAAMAHTATHPPSLQGFVQWLRQSGAEVKRQAEEAGRLVRVMTVHGAKGLQAPVVILPDTTSLPPDGGGLVWTEDGCPLWSPRSELRCAAVDRLRAAARQERMEEYNRLLYVALTRAEDRLVVCGWQTRREAPEECWYHAVRRGMLTLGAVEEELDATDQLLAKPSPSGRGQGEGSKAGEDEPYAQPQSDGGRHPHPGPLPEGEGEGQKSPGEPWPGAVLAYETAQTAPPRQATTKSVAIPPPLPPWAGAPPDWLPHPMPIEPSRPTPLAPSRPTDAALGPVPHAASPVEGDGGALARGALVHLLLQHAPSVADTDRPAAIARYLRAAGADPALADEVMSILAHPALTPLFGPHGRAEQPLSGLVGGTVVSGIVDRIAVLPDRIVLADYKTNRVAPARAEDTPVLYLRQMAAYRAVVQAIFPDQPVESHLVWTRSATVMTLPGVLLDAHAPGAA